MLLLKGRRFLLKRRLLAYSIKWLKKTIKKKGRWVVHVIKKTVPSLWRERRLDWITRNNATWNKSTFKIHHCGDGLWYTAGWFQLRLLPKVTSTLKQKAEFHAWLSTFMFWTITGASCTVHSLLSMFHPVASNVFRRIESFFYSELSSPFFGSQNMMKFDVRWMKCRYCGPPALHHIKD